MLLGPGRNAIGTDKPEVYLRPRHQALGLVTRFGLRSYFQAGTELDETIRKHSKCSMLHNCWKGSCLVARGLRASNFDQPWLAPIPSGEQRWLEIIIFDTQ
jgi:hypothetical protein